MVAFTLAEVLITLTIIGVIAALTIPTLMKNYEKRQIEVGLAKTYQELSNVIKRSEVDNGPFETWQYENKSFNRDFINKYIAPYIKLNICKGYGGDNNSQFVCFKNPSMAVWKTPDNWVSGNYQVQPKYKLSDGRSIAIIPAYYSQWDARSIEFFIDVNGDRGNSMLGIDVFLISYIDYYRNGQRYRGLLCGNADNGGMLDYWKPRDRMISACKSKGTMCSALLMLNNWKFPDDYPIKF